MKIIMILIGAVVVFLSSHIVSEGGVALKPNVFLIKTINYIFEKIIITIHSDKSPIKGLDAISQS